MTLLQRASIESMDNGDAAVAVPRVAPSRESSLDALTGLRFIAAMGVVLYHFALPTLQTKSSILFNIASQGFVAVDLFYLLSGFILSYSYLQLDGTMRGDKRSFWVARLARVYPAYVLGFVMAAPSNIVRSFQVSHVIPAIEKLAISAGSVLTMVQAWTPWTAWKWNSPAWSVSVEAFFYLTFPWVGVSLARLGRPARRNMSVILWFVALAAPFILWITKGVTGPPALGDNLQMAIEFTPLLRLPEFMIGVLLGRSFLLGDFDRLNGNWLTWISSIFLFLILAFFPTAPHPLVANGLLAPAIAVLLIGLAKGRGPIAWFLSLPLLVVLGEASYSIYILQLPLALLIKAPPPFYSIRQLVIYCAALVVCSILSWHFVETPLRGYLRKWGLHSPKKSTAQSPHVIPHPSS